jgi:hypothetical protein
MFHLNATTLLLLHEDKVKHLQKMHEPLPLLREWKFWRRFKQKQEHVGNAETLEPVLTRFFKR